jgi:hypothetical protein
MFIECFLLTCIEELLFFFVVIEWLFELDRRLCGNAVV